MTYRRDLWEIAAAQHGVVTVADAEEAGVPAVEVRKLAGRGALRGYGQGVYRHEDVPVDDLTEAAAAVALAGAGAHLHAEAVLMLFSLGDFNPRGVKVLTDRRVRRRLPPWVQLDRVSQIDEGSKTRYFGIPAVSLAHALQEVRGGVPPHRWESMVETAERRDLLDVRDVADLRAGLCPR